MVKVKTFTSPLRIFHTKEELDNLDNTVNAFLEENNISEVISVSDAFTTDDQGATIGIVRVIAYE
jgi:hypothetical protein